MIWWTDSALCRRLGKILPVIRHAGRPQIVEACLKHSPVWDAVEKLELSENMWVKNSPGDSASFAEFLLKVEGKFDIVKALGLASFACLMAS